VRLRSTRPRLGSGPLRRSCAPLLFGPPPELPARSVGRADTVVAAMAGKPLDRAMALWRRGGGGSAGDRCAAGFMHPLPSLHPFCGAFKARARGDLIGLSSSLPYRRP